MESAGVPTAALVDVGPYLGDGVEDPFLEVILRLGMVPVLELAAGAEVRESDICGGAAFAGVIHSGVLMREIHLGGRAAGELLGPGDVVGPVPDAGQILPAETRWVAMGPSVVAIVSAGALARLGDMPDAWGAYVERIGARSARLATGQAISQLPRVEDRLIAFFSLIGDRWGRAVADGVIVALPLTHAVLGRLVGAARPTVTLALKDLAARGLLVRRSGVWLLAPDALAGLQRDAAPERPVDPILSQSRAPAHMGSLDSTADEADPDAVDAHVLQLHQRVAELPATR